MRKAQLPPLAHVARSGDAACLHFALRGLAGLFVEITRSVGLERADRRHGCEVTDCMTLERRPLAD